MKNHNTYKTIFFDWNKTLSHSLFWHQLAHPQHTRHAWHKNIIMFLFAKNTHIVNDWMRGTIDKNAVTALIAKKFGYAQQTLLDDLAESCRTMTLIDDTILQYIQNIRKKNIACVIATDNMDTFMAYTAPAMHLERYFDDFLISCNQKCLKFDTTGTRIPFFDQYLRDNKLSYEEVLLIDDCVDQSGTYDACGFDIMHISGPHDVMQKVQKLAQ